MRDFQADVIRAAITGKPLPEGGFSWSPARMQLFRFCQRAYFIRYYLAQGGWNIHAHPAARTAYLEKHLPDFNQFLSRTLEQSVSDALFYAVRREKKERTDIFRRALVQGLERRTSALIIGLEKQDYLTDPKLPGLLETFHGETDFLHPEKVGSRCAAVFSKALPPLLEEKDLKEKIENLEPLSLRKEELLALNWRSFIVWLHAGIICTEGDTVTGIRFHAMGKQPESLLPDHGLESALFREYVRQKMHREKTKFNIFSFDEAGKTAYNTVEPGPVAADRVDVSSTGMLRMVRDNGEVCMNDFAPTTEPEKCSFCPFRQTCAMIRSNEIQS